MNMIPLVFLTFFVTYQSEALNINFNTTFPLGSTFNFGDLDGLERIEEWAARGRRGCDSSKPKG